jgi:hypothetical protein
MYSGTMIEDLIRVVARAEERARREMVLRSQLAEVPSATAFCLEQTLSKPILVGVA